MQYWEDMDSKDGFSDGASVPLGIEKYREVYILAMNRLLKKHGSKIRVATHDRSGVHNWVFIIPLPIERVKDWNEKDFLDVVKVEKFIQKYPFPMEEIVGDDASDLAYEEAVEAQLDQYVEVKTTIIPEFAEVLEEFDKVTP